MVRSVSAICGNLTEELDRDLVKCEESVDSSSTSQRMMFIWMVSMIISPEKKNSWHYCPEDNSEGRWHLRMFFVENKVPFEKLASQTGLPPWWANMQTSLRYAEVTHTSQNVYVTTESFTSRRSVQKWPASIMWCLRAFSVLLEELVAQQEMSLQCFFFVSFCLKLKSSCNPKGKMPHWKCLKLKSYWWLMTTDDIRGTWWIVPFHRGRLQHNPL